MSKRGWLAWAVSLVGHGLLVFGIVQFCAFVGRSPDSPKSAVNRVIEKPADYCSISISLDDEPAKPASVLRQGRSNPPVQGPKDQKDPPAVKGQHGRDASLVGQPKLQTQSSGLVQAGHRAPGVMPLHGKLIRPGMAIVYVLDQSGSMARDGKLSQAVAMLKASLRLLGPDVRMQLVTYDSRANIARIAGSSDLVNASEENKAQIEALLDAAVGEGSSRHVEGVIAGLGLHPDVLILLTDADELSAAEIARCREWNRRGTATHAVIFGKRGLGGSSLGELMGPGRLHFLDPAGANQP